MSNMNSFDLSKAPGRMERITFAKSKPKSANDEGAGVKKLTVWVDLSKGQLLKKCAPLFSDVIDEHSAQRIASVHGAGMEVRSKRKLGVSNVKIHDTEGVVLFESAIARVERPKVVIGKEAKTVWLVLVIEMAIAKKSIPILDDYFKADILVSVAVAQLDLEDEANSKAAQKQKDIADRKAAGAAKAAAKTAAKAAEKAKKAQQVDWTKRGGGKK